MSGGRCFYNIVAAGKNMRYVPQEGRPVVRETAGHQSMTDIETRCMRVAKMNVIKKRRMGDIKRHQLRAPETSLINEIRQYAFLDWLKECKRKIRTPPLVDGITATRIENMQTEHAPTRSETIPFCM